MSGRLSRRRLLAGVGTVGVSAIAAGAATESATAKPTLGPHETSDPDGLESFVDDRMLAGLDEHDVVGGAIAVVADGELRLANGYGDATAGEHPVVADETRFRIGSVSKPFVWTAVMQLIEADRIDPDEDVTTYLDSVSIPTTYDQPITTAHLATHTAGFEDRLRGTHVSDADEIRSLSAVLNAEQPDRVRPPGTLVSYSNYATALTAQLVADVTGTPFETYVDEHVFSPLGMDTATFEQPLSDDAVATGYSTRQGSPREGPDYAFELEPAGSMAATVTDLAQFLRAMLNGGGVDGERILEASTIDRMHEQWFTHHEAVDGVAFGWFERSWGETRVLEHDGFLSGLFASRLVLVPEYDFGLAVSTNTDSGLEMSSDVVDAILAAYLPQHRSSTPDPDGPPARAADLDGRYRNVRLVESTPSRLVSTYQAGTVDVTLDGDVLVTTTSETTTEWVERSPLVFDERDGDRTIAFGEEGGEITHVFFGSTAYERVSWDESLPVHAGVTGAAVLGMLSGAAGWPLDRGRQRLRELGSEHAPIGSPDSGTADGSGSETTTSCGGETARTDSDTKTAQAGTSGDDREPPAAGDNWEPQAASNDRLAADWITGEISRSTARWIVGGTIACLLAVPVGIALLLLDAPYTLLSDPPLVFRLLSVVALVGAIGAAVSVWITIRAWRGRWWGRLSRVQYTIVVAATVVFCGLLSYWNVLPIG